MKKRNAVLVFLTVGVIVFFASIHSSLLPSRTEWFVPQYAPSVQKPSPPTHYSYFADQALYEKMFERAGNAESEQRNVSGVILPHHLVVADRIAAMYERLKNQKVKTVLLVGPNHFNAGSENILTSRAKWQTPYGDLLPDQKIIESLIRTGLVSIEESSFAQEHSITAHVAFIKRTWPDARIVPLILKWGTTQDEVEKITHEIFRQAQDDTMMIASVDFSHHQPWWVADFHDELSLGVIESFDQKRIFDLEIDSPPSIALLLKYLTLRSTRAAVRVDHTNTLRLVENLESTENTTHLFEYFVDGEPTPDTVASLLFFPDMMLGRSVAAVSNKNSGHDYPFEQLQGVEGLFFRGFDLLVANLEGPITLRRAPIQKSISFAFDPAVVQTLKKYRFNALSLANNHGYDQEIKGFEDTRQLLAVAGMPHFGHPTEENEKESVLREKIGPFTITLVGFNLTDHKTNNENLKAIVVAAKEQSNFVVVFVHWGVEYQRFPTRSQTLWAHLFIDAGADAVIGHHPHVVETMEIYKNKPVFYSLGNFIFDQYFSQETQEGMGIGVVIKNTEAKYYLIPYTIPKSQPTLMMHTARQEFLKSLAQDSRLDSIHTSMVESGVISLKREPKI